VAPFGFDKAELGLLSSIPIAGDALAIHLCAERRSQPGAVAMLRRRT